MRHQRRRESLLEKNTKKIASKEPYMRDLVMIVAIVGAILIIVFVANYLM